MAAVTDTEIGGFIRDRRIALGISQADMASQLKVHDLHWSQGTLSKVEQGARPVRLSESRQLAQVLGVAWYELLRPPNAVQDARGRLEIMRGSKGQQLEGLKQELFSIEQSLVGLRAIACSMEGRKVYTRGVYSFALSTFAAVTVAEVVGVLRQLGATDDQLKKVTPRGFENTPSVRDELAGSKFAQRCADLFGELATNFEFDSGKTGDRLLYVEGDSKAQPRTLKEALGMKPVNDDSSS